MNKKQIIKVCLKSLSKILKEYDFDKFEIIDASVDFEKNLNKSLKVILKEETETDELETIKKYLT